MPQQVFWLPLEPLRPPTHGVQSPKRHPLGQPVSYAFSGWAIPASCLVVVGDDCWLIHFAQWAARLAFARPVWQQIL